MLPAGTYWVPMAQAQKHWVQAMLNEDTYTPFPYFYDVTGWSNPLLFNLRGGSSGAVLDPAASRVGRLHAPGRPKPPADPPAVAAFSRRGRPTTSSPPAGSATCWSACGGSRTGRWTPPLSPPAAWTAPRCCWSPTAPRPTPPRPWARPASRRWPTGSRAAGATSAGAAAPAWPPRLGITTATLTEPTSDIPGSLLRVRVDRDSPLGDDVGPFAWAFNAYDVVMRASDPAQVAVAYPPAGQPRLLRLRDSPHGEEELGGTAAVVDEPVGSGRAVLFSFEPNFRAFTDGTQRLLRNAVLGPAPDAATVAADRAAEVAAAQAAAGRLSDLDRPIRLTVAAAGAAGAERLLRGYGARFETRRAGGQVHFLVANPRGLGLDEHPFAADLARRLRAADLPVRAFSSRSRPAASAAGRRLAA